MKHTMFHTMLHTMLHVMLHTTCAHAIMRAKCSVPSCTQTTFMEQKTPTHTKKKPLVEKKPLVGKTSGLAYRDEGLFCF